MHISQHKKVINSWSQDSFLARHFSIFLLAGPLKIFTYFMKIKVKKRNEERTSGDEASLC